MPHIRGRLLVHKLKHTLASQPDFYLTDHVTSSDSLV